MLPTPPTMLLLADAPRLAQARAALSPGHPARLALLREAQDALSTPILSVTHKDSLPPSGDLHDYVSLGTYWWPNPNTPDGLPYVRRDGERNPEGDRYDSPRLKRMADAVETLAWAYFFGGGPDMGRHAAALLRAWFLDPATRMNPNLEFGQFIPGVCLGRGVGIIDTATILAGLLDAAQILAAGGALSAEDEAGLRAWMRAYRAWLVQSPHGVEEAAARNNHGTWYDVQLAAVDAALGSAGETAALLREARRRRIAAQVEPGGSQPHELARTRSLSYSLMNLTGFAYLAAIGERVGANLWHWSSPDGRSIRAALDWLLPYAPGGRAWEGEQITPVPPEAFVALFTRAAAAYRDPRYREALQGIPAEIREQHRVNLLV